MQLTSLHILSFATLFWTTSSVFAQPFEPSVGLAQRDAEAFAHPDILGQYARGLDDGTDSYLSKRNLYARNRRLVRKDNYLRRRDAYLDRRDWYMEGLHPREDMQGDPSNGGILTGSAGQNAQGQNSPATLPSGAGGAASQVLGSDGLGPLGREVTQTSKRVGMFVERLGQGIQRLPGAAREIKQRMKQHLLAGLPHQPLYAPR